MLPPKAHEMLELGPAQGEEQAREGSLEQEALTFEKSGRPDLAADLYERLLCTRRKTCPAGHPALLSAAEALTRVCNQAATAQFRTGGDLRIAEKLLQRNLELVAELSPGTGTPAWQASLGPLLHLVLTNLASLDQRRGNPEAALACLQEAEAFCRMIPPCEAAATHLSFCSLLSQLGRHQEAERHAMEAVRLGEADILSLQSLQEPEDQDSTQLAEKVSALAVAYNNLAVQREFLGQAGDCLALYEKAVVLAEVHMEPEDPLLARLRESHRNALQAVAERRVVAVSSTKGSTRRLHWRLPGQRPVSAVERRRPNNDEALGDTLVPGELHKAQSAQSLTKEITNLLRPPLPGVPRAISDSSSDAQTEEPQVPVGGSDLADAQWASDRLNGTRRRPRSASSDPNPPQLAAAEVRIRKRPQSGHAAPCTSAREARAWPAFSTVPPTPLPPPMHRLPPPVAAAKCQTIERQTADEPNGATELAPSRTSSNGSSGPQRALRRARQEAAAVKIQRLARERLIVPTNPKVERAASTSSGSRRPSREEQSQQLQGLAPANGKKPMPAERNAEQPQGPSLGHQATAVERRDLPLERTMERSSQLLNTLSEPQAPPRPALGGGPPERLPRPGPACPAPTLSLPTLGLGPGGASAAHADGGPKLHQDSAEAAPLLGAVKAAAQDRRLEERRPSEVKPPAAEPQAPVLSSQVPSSGAYPKPGKPPLPPGPEKATPEVSVVPAAADPKASPREKELLPPPRPVSQPAHVTPAQDPPSAEQPQAAAAEGPSPEALQGSVAEAAEEETAEPNAVSSHEASVRSFRERGAARAIQRIGRAYVDYLRQSRAAAALQSCLRTALASHSLERKLGAIPRLQRCWRSHRRRLEARRWRAEQWAQRHAASTKIQAFGRGVCSRRFVLLLRRRKIFGARKLQRWFRPLFQARRSATQLLAKVYSVAEERVQQLIRDRAASQLQRAIRGVLARQQLCAVGTLYLLEDRPGGGGPSTRCEVRLCLSRHEGERACRHAAGWQIIASAGNVRRGPLWRNLLFVSIADANRRHSRFQAAEDVAAAKQPPLSAVARTLMLDLNVTVTDGQMVLQLLIMPPTFKAPKATAKAVQGGDKSQEGKDATEEGDVPSEASPGVSPRIVEVPNWRETIPQPACPAWRCNSCGLINEVSPDICVLCDVKREPSTDNAPAAVPAAQPPALPTTPATSSAPALKARPTSARDPSYRSGGRPPWRRLRGE